MKPRPKQNKISVTKNYRLFTRDKENRNYNEKKHKRLLDSMREYGFLSCFPIACWRNEKGDLVVKDGQHRLAFAEQLGLPVYFVEEEVDFDIAVVNSTPKTWSLIDFAEKFSSNGKKQYQEGIDFAEQFSIPISSAFALLAGTVSFGNIKDDFTSGTFKIKDREWAKDVASIYSQIVSLSKQCRNVNLLLACMAVCRVKEFSTDRMIKGAVRCRDKLVAYSTRDAYLGMLEEIYNFGRKQLVPIKIKALQAMKDRNATNGNGKPSTNGN